MPNHGNKNKLGGNRQLITVYAVDAFAGTGRSATSRLNATPIYASGVRGYGVGGNEHERRGVVRMPLAMAPTSPRGRLFLPSHAHLKSWSGELCNDGNEKRASEQNRQLVTMCAVNAFSGMRGRKATRCNATPIYAPRFRGYGVGGIEHGWRGVARMPRGSEPRVLPVLFLLYIYTYTYIYIFSLSEELVGRIIQ